MLLHSFAADQSGSAAIEYCLVASGVFVFAFYVFRGRGSRQLHSLKSENRHLKHLLAEAMLTASALKQPRRET